MTSQRGTASPRWVTALALSAVIGYILLCSSYGGSSTTTADTGTDRARAPSPNSGVVASFSPPLGTAFSRRRAASVESLSSDDPSSSSIDPQQRVVEEDERNVQSTNSRRQPTTPPPYHEWFVRVFSSHFGRAIADALYDAEIFNTMTHSLSEENERGLPEWPLDDGDFEFSSISLKLRPTAPQHFSNISNVLWWAKRWMSVAVSKISRDGELEKLYERVVSGGGSPLANLKLNLLEKTTVRALNAQVQYFHTILQLAIDTCLTWRQKVVLREMAKRHRGTADPLVLLSGWITATTTVEDLAALFSSASNLPLQSTSSTLAEVLEKRAAELATTPNLVGPEDARSLFPLNYDDVPYSQSRPLNGKFWNMLRPTAGCSSIVRLCEIPDGCRLLCNGEYLLHAGRKRQSDNVKAVVTGVQSSHHAAGDGAALPTIVAEAQPKQQQLQGVQGNKQYHHRIIGMGCNNQFDWELSLLSLFQNTEALSTGHHQHHHRIGWMTSMDCTITLAPGRRQWKVPGILKRSAVGYTGASVCAGSSSSFPKDSSSSPINNATTLIGPRDLKAFQLKNEATWGLPTQPDQPLVRFTAHPDAIAASQRRIRQTTETQQGNNMTETENKEFPMLSTASGGSSSRSPLWFDALTILKIDIEGFEWKYIPAWIRGEFKSLSLNAPPQAVAQGSTDAIDFATAVPDFFTVSLFSLEFHRIGFRNITGASSYGALRTHWLSLQVHALGFLMIAHEKNEYSQCCFEYSYVHVRHFIKSEMWMALRDQL